MGRKTKVYVIVGFVLGFGTGIFRKKRVEDLKRILGLAQVEFQTAVKMKEMFEEGCTDEEVAQYYRDHLTFLETAANH